MSKIDVNFACIGMQEQIDNGVNAFAAQLLAECFERMPEEVQAGGLCLSGQGKKQDIYIIMVREIGKESEVPDPSGHCVTRRAYAPDPEECANPL